MLKLEAQVQPRLQNPTFPLQHDPIVIYIPAVLNFLSTSGHKHNHPTAHKTSVTSQLPWADLSSGVFQRQSRGNLGLALYTEPFSGFAPLLGGSGIWKTSFCLIGSRKTIGFLQRCCCKQEVWIN